MDVVERLSPDEAEGTSLIAMTHRHRYELAAELCAGRRVLDLCCGSGYGCEVVARSAVSVTGVDIDAGAIAEAGERFAGPNIAFEQGDATELLATRLADRFDAIVMFEGLEHVADLGAATEGLRRQAADGLTLMISLPNSIPFHEQNPYHLNEFDQETANETFERIGAALVLRQYHAQGSLIRGDSDGPLTGASRLADHVEPEHCNHFLAIFNAPEEAARTVSAQMQMVVAPEENTYMLDLERANKRLWRTNQELARGHLGKADSASAALLAKVPPDPDEEPEPEPPNTILHRFGRRARTVLAMIVPHGFMVLLAKVRQANEAAAEEAD